MNNEKLKILRNSVNSKHKIIKQNSKYITDLIFLEILENFYEENDYGIPYFGTRITKKGDRHLKLQNILNELN